MTNKLIKAIINGNIEEVRNVTAEEPNLLNIASEAGIVPLKLSFHKGRMDIVVTLIKANAYGAQEINDYFAILQNYIFQISETYTCASWLNEIEYILWAIISFGKIKGSDPFHFNRIDKYTKENLKWLSTKCNGWVIYDQDYPQYLPMNKWLSLFDNWKDKNKLMPFES